MSRTNHDSALNFNRSAIHVSHLKARLRAQQRHMDWQQYQLNAARLQARVGLAIAGLSACACLVMFASWGGAA